MNVSIRRAQREDAEALTRIAMLSKQANGYDDAFMKACIEELRVTSSLIEAHEYWGAEGDAPFGFASLEVDPNGLSGEIGAFFIDPDWQQRGIGRLLWSTVKRSAQEKSLKSLRLDADPEAEPFYRGLGLSTVGRVPSGSIPGRMLPHMQVDL